MGNYFWGEPVWILTQIFDLDGERNLPTWYSSMKLSFVAVLLFKVVMKKFSIENYKMWPLVLLPLIFFGLSADEISQIHEYLGEKSDIFLTGGDRRTTFFSETGIWMFLIGIPFTVLLVFLLFYFKSICNIDISIFKKFMLGLFVFLLGALGIEILSNIPLEHTNAYMVEVFFEELCEMIGVSIMLLASYDLFLFNR